MKKITKIVSIFTMLIMSVSVFADGVLVDSLYYIFDTVSNKAMITFPGTSCDNPNPTNVCYTGDIVIPETVVYNGINYTVTAINDCAFRNSKITSVAISNTMIALGSYSFENCDLLTEVSVPNSVVSIGSNAFYDCDNLTYIHLGNSIESIRDGAFASCELLDTLIINTVNCYNDIEIFYNYEKECIDTVSMIEVPCGSGEIYSTQWNLLADYIVERSNFDTNSGEFMTQVGDQFGSSDGKYGYQLLSEDGEIRITSCFSNEAILDLTSLSSSDCDDRDFVLKEISGVYQIENETIEVIKIPNTVTKIGNGNFTAKDYLIDNGNFMFPRKLRRIDFPNSVNRIGRGFVHCDSLRYVSFGRGLTDLPCCIFIMAPNIDTIVCRATVPPVCDVDNQCYFLSCLSSAVLLVPCQSLSLYQNAPMWSDFANIQCLPDLPMDTITATIQKGTKYSFYGEDYRLAGVYTVDLDDSVHTLVLNVIDNSGIIDVNEDNDIIVYPVPAEDKLTLYFNNMIDYDNIQIHNLNGTLVYQSKINNAQNIVEIDVSKFSSGAYILTISNNKNIVTKKIIIN